MPKHCSAGEPLTLSQALVRLQQIAARTRHDPLLGVPFDPGQVTVGPAPVRRVTLIGPGTDWDRQTLFLYPDQPLAAPTDDLARLRADLGAALETIGMIGVALRSSLTPEARLKAVKSHFNAFLTRERDGGKPAHT